MTSDRPKIDDMTLTEVYREMKELSRARGYKVARPYRLRSLRLTLLYRLRRMNRIRREKGLPHRPRRR